MVLEGMGAIRTPLFSDFEEFLSAHFRRIILLTTNEAGIMTNTSVTSSPITL
jgi:hypothetical protein